MPTQYPEMNPKRRAYLKRKAKRERREEERWASLAGPVTVRRIGSAVECAPRDQERARDKA